MESIVYEINDYLSEYYKLKLFTIPIKFSEVKQLIEFGNSDSSVECLIEYYQIKITGLSNTKNFGNTYKFLIDSIKKDYDLFISFRCDNGKFEPFELYYIEADTFIDLYSLGITNTNKCNNLYPRFYTKVMNFYLLSCASNEVFNKRFTVDYNNKYYTVKYNNVLDYIESITDSTIDSKTSLKKALLKINKLSYIPQGIIYLLTKRRLYFTISDYILLKDFIPKGYYFLCSNCGRLELILQKTYIRYNNSMGHLPDICYKCHKKLRHYTIDDDDDEKPKYGTMGFTVEDFMNGLD